VKKPHRKRAGACLVMVLISSTVAAQQSPGGRWALGPHACDGEAHTRPDTPLIVEPMSVRWFNADCAVVGSYRVKDIWYLQGRCTVEGKAATIPLMLDLRGDRLVIGWNREPVIEMQRCRP
jgi:hypothetical protein